MHHSLLPLIFVLTGTSNILLSKWSDSMLAECSDGKLRRFQHPMVQTCLMFIGEFFCFVLFKLIYFFLQRRGDNSENENMLTRGTRDFPKVKLFVPAFFDVLASIMLFTGLYLTYTTSFQFLRSGSIIFVAIFSTIYLNQELTVRHWMAMAIVLCGLGLVILSDLNRIMFDKASVGQDDVNSILTADLLILCAQILHAFKYVYEEKHIKDYDIPTLQAVGWQGIFGLIMTSFLAIVMNYVPTLVPFNDNSHEVFDDLNDAFTQVFSNTTLLISLLSFVILCACYNFVSLHIIKLTSAANCLLADSLRLSFIWIIVLLLKWENFNFMIFVAFVILQMGAIDYRRAIFLSWYRTLLGRIAARRYDNLQGEQTIDGGAQPTNHAADVI